MVNPSTASACPLIAAAPGEAGTQIQIWGDSSWSLMTVICILLFIGAMGKSAQLGLHTWLPDAMEGPTPVSALIHAATMVTAGVYMVARNSALYALAPDTMMIVAIIGALTAIMTGVAYATSAEPVVDAQKIGAAADSIDMAGCLVYFNAVYVIIRGRA